MPVPVNNDNDDVPPELQAIQVELDRLDKDSPAWNKRYDELMGEYLRNKGIPMFTLPDDDQDMQFDADFQADFSFMDTAPTADVQLAGDARSILFGSGPVVATPIVTPIVTPVVVANPTPTVVTPIVTTPAPVVVTPIVVATPAPIATCEIDAWWTALLCRLMSKPVVLHGEPQSVSSVSRIVYSAQSAVVPDVQRPAPSTYTFPTALPRARPDGSVMLRPVAPYEETIAEEPRSRSKKAPPRPLAIVIDLVAGDESPPPARKVVQSKQRTPAAGTPTKKRVQPEVDAVDDVPPPPAYLNTANSPREPKKKLTREERMLQPWHFDANPEPFNFSTGGFRSTAPAPTYGRFL